jgi:hypothetical protein
MTEIKQKTLLKDRVDLRLLRLADVLLLNASITDNPGLLNGKMGIAIFLYHFARRKGIEMYSTYAGELIDEIYEGVSTQTPVDFADGLTGIGWGIEYLVRNGFVEADTDEALSEIDNSIYRSMFQQPLLTENGNDLFGYGFYYLSRLLGRENEDDNLNTLIKKQQLIYLTDECERLLILKRYLDFNIKSLSVGTINSIAWFLLEMHKLNLFPLKVDKLLRHLPSELEFTLKTSDDPVADFVLWHIVQNIIPLISDTGVQEKFVVIAKPSTDNTIGTYTNDEILVNNFAAIAWQKLIYYPYIKEDTQLPQITGKAFNIIDDEENWTRRLDKLNKDNMGLTGLAGLGLELMNESI